MRHAPFPSTISAAPFSPHPTSARPARRSRPWQRVIRSTRAPRARRARAGARAPRPARPPAEQHAAPVIEPASLRPAWALLDEQPRTTVDLDARRPSGNVVAGSRRCRTSSCLRRRRPSSPLAFLRQVERLVEHLLVDAVGAHDLARRTRRPRSAFLDGLRRPVVADEQFQRVATTSVPSAERLAALEVRLDALDAPSPRKQDAGGSKADGSRAPAARER